VLTTGGILLLLYAAGAVFTTIRIGAALAWEDYPPRKPGTDDYALGLLLGGLLALSWPLTLPGYLFVTSPRLRSSLLRPPPLARARLREAELRERERRVAALEREAGLR
jgi:hypothetical protein